MNGGAGSRTIEYATCLGCGCACDDITVVVRDRRIAEARRACALGAAWFGDGAVPSSVLVRGAPVTAEGALDHAAHLLATAARPLVILAAGISCEAQRSAVALADRLRARLATLTALTAAEPVLAAQRRGRAGATLGELRQRADVLLFWGVDPAERYPRFLTRYAPEPAGLFVPGGRRERTIIAADIGPDRGPADADVRIAFAPGEEIDALVTISAAAAGHPPAGGALAARVGEIVPRLQRAHYAAIIADGEPRPGRDPRRAEALLVLADTLNATTRAVITTLRAGGNRSGADAVLTWQTGFPMAVDFARGVPRYDGAATAAWLAPDTTDTVLVIGDPASLPEAARSVLGAPASIIVGPRASTTDPRPVIAIDTGVAGIHEGGMAMRMDDVPLPLRPSLPGPPDARAIVAALGARIDARLATDSRAAVGA